MSDRAATFLMRASIVACAGALFVNATVVFGRLFGIDLPDWLTSPWPHHG